MTVIDSDAHVVEQMLIPMIWVELDYLLKFSKNLENKFMMAFLKKHLLLQHL